MKRRILPIIIGILVIISLISFQKILRKEQQYTNKLIEIIKKDEEYALSQEELEEYKSEIEKEAEKNIDITMKKKSNYALGVIEYLEKNYEASINKLLKTLEQKGKDDETIDLMIYSTLSSNYITLGNLEESDKYFSKAEEVALKKNMKNELSDIYYGRARTLARRDYNIKDSIKLLEEAIELGNGYERNIRNYLYIATLYRVNGQNELALKYSRLALELAYNKKDEDNIDQALINLGESYYLQRDYEKIIYIYEELIKTSNIENSHNKIHIYGFLMESYAKISDFEKCNEYKEKALIEIEKIKEEDRNRELAWIYMIYSNIKIDQGEIEASKEYFNRVNELYQKNKMDMYSNTNLYLEELGIKINYKEEKNYAKSLKGYENLLLKVKNKGIKTDILNFVTEDIINISKENKDYYTTVKYTEEMNNNLSKSNGTIATEDVFNEIKDRAYERDINKSKQKIQILIIMILSMGGIVTTIFYKNKKIKRLNKKLKELSITDPLTQTFNKRHLYDKFTELYQNKKTVCFIMIDIDYFKLYNDNYGHLKGDEVLVKVSTVIKEAFHEDLVFRYGGEEFSIISEKSREDCIENIKTLRERLINLNISHEYSKVSDRITLSIGCEGGRINSLEEVDKLIALADKKLYESKERGRNNYT